MATKKRAGKRAAKKTDAVLTANWSDAVPAKRKRRTKAEMLADGDQPGARGADMASRKARAAETKAAAKPAPIQTTAKALKPAKQTPAADTAPDTAPPKRTRRASGKSLIKMLKVKANSVPFNPGLTTPKKDLARHAELSEYEAGASMLALQSQIDNLSWAARDLIHAAAPHETGATGDADMLSTERSWVPLAKSPVGMLAFELQWQVSIMAAYMQELKVRLAEPDTDA